MTAGQQVMSAGVLGLGVGLAVLHIQSWWARRRATRRHIPSNPWSRT